MKKLLISTIVLSLFFCGCASKYIAIDWQEKSNAMSNTQSEIELRYKEDIVNKSNKKYLKKIVKKDLRIVAVEITNNTDQNIKIDSNAFFFLGYTSVTLLGPEESVDMVQQERFLYFLYMLLATIWVEVESTSNATLTANLGVIPGLILTILNFTKASTANKQFISDLEQFDLRKTIIEPGEKVKGIINFQSDKVTGLNLSLDNQN